MKRLLILPIVSFIGAAMFCSGFFTGTDTAATPDVYILDNASQHSDSRVDENLLNVTTRPTEVTPEPSVPADSDSETAPDNNETPEAPADTTTRFTTPNYNEGLTVVPDIEELEPAVTTTTPAATTTSKVPETTTKAPVTTTKPPVTTTKPPVTTTKPPVTTTKAPETTKAPVVNAPTASTKDKIVSIAKSQIGVAESGHNNVKYNTWYYGHTVRDKSSSGTTYAWCGVFISWCANQAGISESIIPRTASSRAFAQWYNDRGQYTKYSSSYTPKVGDLIFIDWQSKRGGISNIDHVGIVVAVENGVITTVEGNYSNKVSCNTYAFNSRAIVGYATPAYK